MPEIHSKVNHFPRRFGITVGLCTVVLIYCLTGWILGSFDGLLIGAVAALILVIITSLVVRTKERTISAIELDQTALKFVENSCCEHMGVIRLLAQKHGLKDYEKLLQDARRKHSIQKEEGNFIFVEVIPKLESHDTLLVTGHEVDKYRVLRCNSPAVANAIAALLLHLRDKAGNIPHIYLSWSEGHPLAYSLRYAIFGEGETAPLIREILRTHEPQPERRPIVHVA